MKIVILAGGKGTRLWPVSRNKRPKQIVPLLKGKTLIEETLKRLKGEIPLKDVYVLIGKAMFRELKKTVPRVAQTGVNIMIEPGSRDTGPAMAWAAAILGDKYPDEPLLFMASDHYIRDKEALWKSIRVQEQLVKETGKLLDISIIPQFPSTALGYTKIDGLFREVDGVEVYNFRGHREKPDFKSAKKMVESGNFLWHANFYMWTPRKFLAAFQAHAPQLFKGIVEAKKNWEKKNHRKAREIYSQLERISFDYAITEKLSSQEVLIVKGDFGWNDIGSWSALHDEMLSQGDEQRNVTHGNWLGFDTSNCFVLSTNQKKVVATVGIDDIVVIDTEDALLICPRGRSQDVKKIVEELQKSNKKKYL